MSKRLCERCQFYCLELAVIKPLPCLLHGTQAISVSADREGNVLSCNRAVLKSVYTEYDRVMAEMTIEKLAHLYAKAYGKSAAERKEWLSQEVSDIADSS